MDHSPLIDARVDLSCTSQEQAQDRKGTRVACAPSAIERIAITW
jgi:hypothetical protein